MPVQQILTGSSFYLWALKMCIQTRMSGVRGTFFGTDCLIHKRDMFHFCRQRYSWTRAVKSYKIHSHACIFSKVITRSPGAWPSCRTQHHAHDELHCAPAVYRPDSVDLPWYFPSGWILTERSIYEVPVLGVRIFHTWFFCGAGVLWRQMASFPPSYCLSVAFHTIP